MPCRAVPCHAMSCHVMSCDFKSLHELKNMSCHVMSCHVMSTEASGTRQRRNSGQALWIWRCCFRKQCAWRSWPSLLLPWETCSSTRSRSTTPCRARSSGALGKPTEGWFTTWWGARSCWRRSSKSRTWSRGSTVPSRWRTWIRTTTSQVQCSLHRRRRSCGEKSRPEFIKLFSWVFIFMCPHVMYSHVIYPPCRRWQKPPSSFGARGLGKSIPRRRQKHPLWSKRQGMNMTWTSHDMNMKQHNMADSTKQNMLLISKKHSKITKTWNNMIWHGMI